MERKPGQTSVTGVVTWHPGTWVLQPGSLFLYVGAQRSPSKTLFLVTSAPAPCELNKEEVPQLSETQSPCGRGEAGT